MEILVTMCSYQACGQHPELFAVTKDGPKFSCEKHADDLGLESGEIARAINVEEQKAFIKNSQILISTLKQMKSEILNSVEKLTQTIMNHCKDSIKRIDLIVEQIRHNIHFVLSKNKLFDRIENNVLENVSMQMRDESKVVESLSEMIAGYFKRDFFQPFQLVFSGGYHELIDSRLISPKTTPSKKLQLLSKTFAFTKTPIQTVGKKDINSCIPTTENNPLGKPDHLLLLLEKQLIITVNNRIEIQFWKIVPNLKKICDVKCNSVVIGLLLIPSTDNLIVIFEKTLGKLSISKQSFSHFQLRQVETMTIFKLFKENSLLATATYDGKILVWSTESLMLITEYSVQSIYFNGSISCFDISNDSKLLASGGVSGEIDLRPLIFAVGASGEMLLRPLVEEGINYKTSGHGGGVSAIAFSPNGVYMISGGEDNYIKIWSVQNPFTAIYKKKVSDMKIKEISFSLDSSLVLTGAPKRVIMWRVGMDDRSFGYVKIDKRGSMAKFGIYFSDAMCYLKYF